MCRQPIWLIAAGTLILAGWPPRALAHDGQLLAPHDLLYAWQPVLLLVVALGALVYTRGVRSLWRRAGRGHGVHRWQVVAFFGGIIALVVALASPLDALSAVLLTAHMVQHLLLIVVAAPLLVLAAPYTALLWALPFKWRWQVARWMHRTPVRTIWHVATQPAIATIAHIGALLLWHVPGLYQWALDSDLMHMLEHGSFLLTALLFWWTLLAPEARLHCGAGILAIFATAMTSGVLGAFMTFALTPWYPSYAGRAAAWGWTGLGDQQFAGVLMWMPPGAIYLAAAVGLFAVWLRAVERRVQQREERSQAAHEAIAIGEGDVV